MKKIKTVIGGIFGMRYVRFSTLSEAKRAYNFMKKISELIDCDFLFTSTADYGPLSLRERIICGIDFEKNGEDYTISQEKFGVWYSNKCPDLLGIVDSLAKTQMDLVGPKIATNYLGKLVKKGKEKEISEFFNAAGLLPIEVKP